MTWPALVSWAVDTRLLAAYNLTRCFFRTEVRPADGGLAMLDYRHAIDVRPESKLKRLDVQATDSRLYEQVLAEVAGLSCGKLPNNTALPCIANRHFTASPYPFQVGHTPDQTAVGECRHADLSRLLVQERLVTNLQQQPHAYRYAQPPTGGQCKGLDEYSVQRNVKAGVQFIQ
jgi:hypothetical protein